MGARSNTSVLTYPRTVRRNPPGPTEGFYANELMNTVRCIVTLPPSKVWLTYFHKTSKYCVGSSAHCISWIRYKAYPYYFFYTFKYYSIFPLLYSVAYLQTRTFLDFIIFFVCGFLIIPVRLWADIFCYLRSMSLLFCLPVYMSVCAVPYSAKKVRRSNTSPQFFWGVFTDAWLVRGPQLLHAYHKSHKNNFWGCRVREMRSSHN